MHIDHPGRPVAIQGDRGPGRDAAVRRCERYSTGTLPGGVGDKTADVDVAITAVIEDRVDGAVARDADDRQISEVATGDQHWFGPRVFPGIQSLQHQVV